jgi:DNA topoisomerase II
MAPNTPPPPQKSKGTVKAKAKAGASEGKIQDDGLASRYKKMTQIEHILKLPDTYIGSTEMSEPQEYWVWNAGEGKMERRAVAIVPGLFKIFDEILVNAYDQWIRCREMNAKHQVKEIAVSLGEDSMITVRNDGEGIDVEIHPEHGIWVPELIFGHLLTSGNYEQKGKITGGKNGLGAKCGAVYSSVFRIETVDHKRKRKYTQEFRDNLGVRDTPIIEENYTGKPYTQIQFLPDYKRFGGLESLDDAHRALFTRRVIDLTACTDKTVAVSLNGKVLPIKTLERYVDLYVGEKSEHPRVYERVDDRWEVVVALSPTEAFDQVSFVNGVATSKGGKHVDYLAKMISEKLAKVVEKKAAKKKVELKPAAIREQMWLFARTVIEDPGFDSQTKEYMTTAPSAFGSKCQLSDGFYEKLAKTGITDKAIALAEFRSSYALQKSDGKKKSTLRGIPKLDDANWAGTPKSHECTLILTEGDSAKTFAISGLSVVGRDKYGVFPLRGKLLNVRDATVRQVADNVEIDALKKILGLKQGMIYTKENVGELRYGNVMLLTDADVDGSHIRGLLMNFFHTFWPSLMEIPGFLQTMMTPIVKAKRGGRNGEQKIFYSWAEYQAWKQNLETEGKWELRYYKGLGTSTSAEAKEYFSDLKNTLVKYQVPPADAHRFVLVYESEEEDQDAIIEEQIEAEKNGELEQLMRDMEKKNAKKKGFVSLQEEEDVVKQAFLLAFGKEYANARKRWLERYDPNALIDGVQATVHYDEFIHKDLIHFSKYDCERSVPSLVDGLKPSQRKVLHAVFQRNLTKAMKVAQLAAYVAEKTAYHHGEQSLNGAIVGLAQDFVGSNNFPPLMPEGQMGSRLQGGKDSASPRYIFTRMNPLLPALFPEADRPLLKYLDDDGTPIEPEYFVPILPLVLVNGAEGIGTGFSCRVPTFHPRVLAENLKRLMEGEECLDMEPWTRGFKGRLVETVSTGVNRGMRRWSSHGVVQQVSLNQLEITELPVGVWTDNYKEQLEDWILNKKDFGLIDYESHYTESEVRFVLRFQPGVIATWRGKGGMERVEKELKLVEGKRFTTTNMHLFNPQGQIRKYQSALDILTSFYEVRRAFYVKRKEYQLERLRRDITFLQYRVKFIKAVVEGEMEVSRRAIDELEAELRAKGYPKARRQNGMWYLIEQKAEDGEEETTEDSEEGEDDMRGSYEYLLGLPLRTLTKEKFEALQREREAKEEERLKLERTDVLDIWREELDTFVNGFEAQVLAWQEEMSAFGSPNGSGKGKQKQGGGSRKKTPVASSSSKGKTGVKRQTVRQRAQVVDSEEE